MFEIYASTTRRKHYLISTNSANYDELVKEGRKYFRCGESNLEIEKGWILNDELFLENPHKKGAKPVAVVSHWRKLK